MTLLTIINESKYQELVGRDYKGLGTRKKWWERTIYLESDKTGQFRYREFNWFQRIIIRDLLGGYQKTHSCNVKSCLKDRLKLNDWPQNKKIRDILKEHLVEKPVGHAVQLTAFPELQQLVDDYRNGTQFQSESYKKYFFEIMSELGYQNGGLDERGNPIAAEFEKLLEKIRVRLGFRKDCFSMKLVVLDDQNQLALEDLIAFVEHEGAHFSTWIRQGKEGQFYLCPEYLEISGEWTTTLQPKQINRHELVGKYGYAIYSKMHNPSIPKSRGRLPNIHSCAFEACVHVLSEVLPQLH